MLFGNNKKYNNFRMNLIVVTPIMGLSNGDAAKSNEIERNNLSLKK